MATSERRDGPERRRTPRQAARIPLDYSTVDAFFSEFASNINEGGMFIETESPSELDAVVQLLVRFPDVEEPVQLEARVVRVSDGKAGEPAGMGVEFQELTPEVRETINAVVCKLRNDS